MDERLELWVGGIAVAAERDAGHEELEMVSSSAHLSRWAHDVFPDRLSSGRPTLLLWSVNELQGIVIQPVETRDEMEGG